MTGDPSERRFAESTHVGGDNAFDKAEPGLDRPGGHVSRTGRFDEFAAGVGSCRDRRLLSADWRARCRRAAISRLACATCAPCGRLPLRRVRAKPSSMWPLWCGPARSAGCRRASAGRARRTIGSRTVRSGQPRIDDFRVAAVRSYQDVCRFAQGRDIAQGLLHGIRDRDVGPAPTPPCHGLLPGVAAVLETNPFAVPGESGAVVDPKRWRFAWLVVVAIAEAVDL